MTTLRSFMGRIAAFGATLGPIGYLPAPGTCGTIAAIFLLFGARYMGAWYGVSNLVMTCSVMVLAFILIEGALWVLPGRDPQQIVVDEVVGYFVAMYMFSFSLIPLVLTFILFRLFDIEKPWGINLLQDLPGAWGIISDDVAAGILTGFVVSWVGYALKLVGIVIG